MAGIDSHFLISFLSRWIHVASMAVIFGGSFFMWGVARGYRSGSETPSGRSTGLLALSQQYEWFFWVGMGLLALTGIGNLGNFGANLPGTASAWGSRLFTKLILVIVLVLFSSIRLWVIAGIRARLETHSTARVGSLLQNLYAGTLLFLVVILVLAVSLSHG